MQWDRRLSRLSGERHTIGLRQGLCGWASQSHEKRRCIMNPITHHSPRTTYHSRRHFLKQASCGFGYLALAGLATEAAAAANPLAAKRPHFTARAKRVIFLFMDGGPSHVDTFDYKPKLNADAGQPVRNQA